MPCYHPIPAWRNESTVQLSKPLPDATKLLLPCGTCLGCRTTRAQHWALRCKLESFEHRHNCVTTLTYDDAHLPPVLQKEHFQLWMKRLRKEFKNKIKYFASGEYGEKFGRPHYHALLFGVRHKPKFPNDTDHEIIQDTWNLGNTYTDLITPEAINYVAGYVNKKLEWQTADRETMIDYETGEILWEPPFTIMSRRPGIGGEARKHINSWALYAVDEGHKLSVPRYYQEYFKNNANEIQQEAQQWNKYKHALTRHETTEEQLTTREKNHYARHRKQRANRKYE